jgi:hypothetical protein
MTEVAVATMAASVPTAILSQPNVRAVVGSDFASCASGSDAGPDVKRGGSEAGARALSAGGAGDDAHPDAVKHARKPEKRVPRRSLGASQRRRARPVIGAKPSGQDGAHQGERDSFVVDL